MVHRETIGAVAMLTMDGPPVNALNTGMYNALIERIAELEDDPSVRVVVMRAASGIRVFSAGGDIKEFDRYNVAYREFFKDVTVLPARTTVQSVLWNGIKVEIDCVAKKSG